MGIRTDVAGPVGDQQAPPVAEQQALQQPHLYMLSGSPYDVGSGQLTSGTCLGDVALPPLGYEAPGGAVDPFLLPPEQGICGGPDD